jgi:hypothetical protein
MAKYRNREIITAEQWFPGKTLNRVHMVDGQTYLHRIIDTQGHSAYWASQQYFHLLTSGDYIVTTADGFTDVLSKSEFEIKYENIGGC